MYRGPAPSTPVKQYRKLRKTLLVDSRDRLPSQTPTKYTVNLPKVYENVYSVALRSAEIPFTWYVFSAANGNTTMHVSGAGSGNTVAVTIPDGNYTSDTIVTALNAAFASAGRSAITCVYDTVTSKLVFTSTSGDFVFRFSGYPQQSATCGSPQIQTPTSSWWGLGYFLGFNQVDQTSSSSTLSSNFIVQLNAYNYILMELDFINKEDETSYDGRLSGRVDGCFAKIPITGNTNDIIFYRDVCTPMNRSVMSPPLSQLKSLSVKFRFHNGQLINFNNVDHSFTLEFELLENGFDEYSSLEFAPM